MAENVPDQRGTAQAVAARPFPTLGERVRRRSMALVDRWRADPGRLAEGAMSLVAVLLGTGLVLATLHPGDLFSNSTPTGGDMGAHVWGPRYLLDHLLPNFRLSGWTPDWYNGFPAYQFYMVVPSLLIVALNVGLPWYLAVPVVLAAVAAVVAGWAFRRAYPYRYAILTAATITAVLTVPVSYNRSFKLITALGLLALPAACWACARLADLPFPIPPLASMAALLFAYNREPLYNNTGNIIGGNFQSTMAGEFAFSISLTVAVLYLGVAARGLRTGRYRALAAALFALAGLCHLIPAFFVLGCTAALFIIHPDRARLKWLATMVPVAGLLTAFWVLPFWWRRDYVNDMGWEKLPLLGAEAGEAGQKLAGDQGSVWYYLLPHGLRWLMVAALVGVLVSVVRRYSVGLVLAFAWAGVMVAFSLLPQARLWNARLLPFMYLSVALLAAIAAGEVFRILAAAFNGRPDRPLRPISVGLATCATFGVLMYTALPLHGLFDGIVTQRTVNVDGVSKTEASWWRFSTTASNPVAGWSAWNYSGLEAKEPQPAGCDSEGSKTPCTTGGWPEYRDLMATMAGLGQDPAHGCGRSFWEYDNERTGGYGTPMAPMMLPFWTDGCIGSQEGLYFESSATVPHHFLVQSELSASPSRPQRELPYPNFDIDAGVRHLQLLGVKYYMAVTETAIGAASNHPDLTEVAVSGPWHVYQVADAPVVAPMEFEPVVATGIGAGQHEWLPSAISWFLNPEDLDVPLAISGPDEWKRVPVKPVADSWRDLVRWTREQLGESGPMDEIPDLPRTELPAIEVTDVEQGRDQISFTVSEVGVPVLVKTSYFPNWNVDGAQGPYRVAPNLMVVVPTQEHVTLDYGRTPIDLAAAGLSLLGLVGLVLLARRGPIDVPEWAPSRMSARLDRLIEAPRDEADWPVDDDDDPVDDQDHDDDDGPGGGDGVRDAELSVTEPGSTVERDTLGGSDANGSETDAPVDLDRS